MPQLARDKAASLIKDLPVKRDAAVGTEAVESADPLLQALLRGDVHEIRKIAGYTALRSLCMKYGHVTPEIAALLSDLKPSKSDDLILLLANEVEEGHTEGAINLLAKDRFLVDRTISIMSPKSGNTSYSGVLLDLAAARGMMPLLRLLVEQNIDVRSKHRLTKKFNPLHHAVINRQTDALAFLLKHTTLAKLVYENLMDLAKKWGPQRSHHLLNAAWSTSENNLS